MVGTTSLKRSAADDNEQPFNFKKSRMPDEDPSLPTGPSHVNCPLDPSSSDFASMVGSGTFVDKSHALRDFLHGEPTPIHLLLCPRRSGRTTLLRMFRDFFKLTGPDEQARRRGLFKNLTIAKEKMFETEFGNYPVIYLDFSNLSDDDTMATLLLDFKLHVTSMVRELEDSNHFQNRDELPKNQRQFLEAVLQGTIDDSELPDVLFELTEILFVLHKKKVILLIDEYDTPVSYASKHGYFSEANQFFREVYTKLLKNNEHLRGAMLVGILHIADLNNIEIFPLGDTSRYSTAIMFTENETRSLYDRQNKIKPLPFTFDDLQKWYNGYSTQDGIKLFNPWSVSNALTEAELRRWRTESGHDATIQARVVTLLDSDEDFRSKCEDLLIGEKIDIELGRIGYDSLPTLSKQQLWTFMYHAGYLTRCPGSSNSDRISVRIPNIEIKSEFRAWMRSDFERRTNQLEAGYGSSVSLFHDMVNGKFLAFSKAFGEFVLAAMPQGISHEKVYQIYVYALFSGTATAMANQTWTTRMEAVAGDRTDIILHDETKAAILKLKRIPSPHPKKDGYRDKEESLLSKATNDALDQCDTEHYRDGMPNGVTTVYEYGIAFLGPYCAVGARTVERVDGKWITRNNYAAQADEKRRKDTYQRNIEGVIGNSVLKFTFTPHPSPFAASLMSG